MLIAILFIIFAGLISFAITYVLRQLVANTSWEMELWDRCLTPLRWSFIFFILIVAQKVWGSGSELKLLFILKPFWGTGLTICGAWLITRLSAAPRMLYLKRWDINNKDNLKVRKVLTQFTVIV